MSPDLPAGLFDSLPGWLALLIVGAPRVGAWVTKLVEKATNGRWHRHRAAGGSSGGHEAIDRIVDRRVDAKLFQTQTEDRLRDLYGSTMELDASVEALAAEIRALAERLTRIERSA